MVKRALLTDTERAILAAGEGERYRKAASQIQNRINEQLPKDIELLREHHPELYDSLTRVTDRTG